MDLDFAADENLRELSGEEAWETIENFAQGQKEWDNPPNIISEQEIEILKVYLVKEAWKVSFDYSQEDDLTRLSHFLLHYLSKTREYYCLFLYFIFGRHLDELHVTWALLEKKRTRLQTNTKTLEDLCSQSPEMASQAIHDAVTTHQKSYDDRTSHLEYAFLEQDSLLLVVISALLQVNEKKCLISIPKKHKEAFAWKTSDISGISLSFFKHKINFEDDVKPVIQRQRRLNPNMKEVVKKEIIKHLNSGIIYAIEDTPWVSLVHCVPKKGGMIVVTNEKNEFVPTRTVTGWRVCIDYRKLNEATYHFPLHFIDQMLERLAGNKLFSFLNGFSSYFQIPIEPADQEKTTFTCPYGTYAYKRMSFGLCNAPATFQRCMIAIFQDMHETSMEVFMDDFLVFGN
ncbi:reverse transcriptase domain-containing protein [Tanacetum coccineum]